MKQVALSICITTRNRANYVGQSLDSILMQVENGVEIVVVDGASTDGTQDILRQYQERYPTQLRYIRRESNSGVDRDYNFAAEAALGEYCWFMSDDDLLKPSAIRTVMEATNRGYDMIVVNAEDWNVDFTKKIGEGRLSFSDNRTYPPHEREKLFLETAYHLSFIPALVIRRKLWLSRERERYFGTWFAHVGVVFQQPFDGVVLAIANPLIAIRNGNISWGGRTFEIWLVHWPELIWSLSDIRDEIKNKICYRDPWQKWRFLLLYRALGAYSSNQYRQFILPRTTGYMSRVVPRVLSRFPIRPLNLLFFLFTLINYRRYKITFLAIVESPYFLFSRIHKMIKRSTRQHNPGSVAI